jgi:spermine oxidase
MYLVKGGKEVDPSLVEDISNRVEDVLSKLNTDYTDKQTIDQVLAQIKEGQWNTEYEGLFKWHQNYQLIDNACYRMNELSVDAWKQYEECEGPYCQTIRDGFSSIIQRIKSGIPSEKIRCSQVVQRVEWDENVDNSSNNNSLPTVTVILKNGDKINCKHLIVTCSAGYLKKHKDIFNPPLPNDWRSALDRCIGFGPVIKILLVFEKKFWKGDCKGFQFVWTEANPDDYWPQYMDGFDVVQSTESETVLLGWLGGVGCGFLENSEISDAELGQECVKLLKDFTSIQDIPNPKLTIR